MSSKTSSSHPSPENSNQITMSTALTNSPAELMVNLVNNSSPSSNSSLGGDELLNNLNQHNIVNESSIIKSNSTNQNNTNSENELNNLLINNQSPLCLNNSSSPLSNNSLIVNTTNNLKEELSNKDNLNKQQIQFNEIYNQNNNSNNLNNLIPINIASNNQTSSPKSTINSNSKMNVKLETSENLSPLNTSSNSSSSNITSAQQSSSSVPLSSSVQSHVQWTGTNSNNNYPLNGNNVSSRYPSSVSNNSYHSNFGSVTNNHGSSSNSFQPSNTSNNSNNPTNSPYIEYNGYSGQILSQPSTPPSTVPNMFTAAAVAAASSGALNNSQSGTPKSSSINSSEFSFNGNNSNSSNSSLSSTKKYLATPPSSVGSVVLESQQSNIVHSDSIDQALFYGSTNNSTLSNNGSGLNKNNILLQQSPQKPQPAQLTEFSAPLVNNYANFAPNSNSYWQPGSTTPQMNMSNGNVYQQQHNKQAIMQSSSTNSLIHHNIPSTGHQLDEASQASTPNSQLDELRSETPSKNGSQTPITNSNYLNTVSMNNVSNNSSSNSSTSSTNSSNGPNNSNNVNNLNNNGKGMPIYSFPPTPNTIGSPGTSVMSAGFYDEYESAPNTTWSKNHRLDGLMKLYEISNEPGRKIFLDKLISFNEERGTTISSCPTINKNLIDLYRLYTCVKERGGFLQATKAKLWKEIATICDIRISTTTAYILRKQYVKHLLGYECKYELNGADVNQIVAQTENANRKKRKSKAGSDQSSPIQGPSMINTNGQLGPSKDMSSIQPNQIPGQAHHLHPSHIAQSQHQAGIHHHPQQQALINGSMSQHSTLNSRQQQPPSQQSNISMQQPYSNSIMNMGNSNSNNSNSTIISNGPNSFSTNINGYSGYNNNVSMSNYVPTNNNGNIYGTNNIYNNNSSIDYNNSKMSVHQLPVQQQTNFFPNGPMVNNSPNGNINNNQSNSLVSNSIQPSSQHMHNTSLQSQPISHQQTNLNQHQNYFSNNSNSNIMYNNNSLMNGTINNSVPSQNEFYGTYSTTSNNSSVVHPQNTNSMYNISNSNPNSIQQSVYNEEMMKFNSSRQQPMNDISSTNTNANLPQSSLPPQQQLNSSNNSDNQYLTYNGHPDSNYSNNIYNAPSRQQTLSNNGYSTINNYNNGPTMLESNNFEKNSSSKNLMDFHSLKSGPITSANNGGIALDTYMTDPYYEPENKRFHAMSNC